MDFDKFAWIRAVSADSQLAASDRLILVNVALFSVLGGQGTFSTKQTTIAQRCGTTARQVRRAITAGRSNGYVELIEERQRGRGYRRGDEHRLIWPTVIPDNLSAIHGEIPDKSVRNTGQNGQEYRTESTRIADNANSLTSANDTPKDIEKDLYKEGGKDAALAAPPPLSQKPANHEDVSHPETWPEYVASVNGYSENGEGLPVEKPSRFCQRHPGGTNDPCGACGRQRIAHQEWKEARAEWVQDNAELRAEIKACRRCNDLGQYTDEVEGLLLWCDHRLPPDPDCPRCRGTGHFKAEIIGGKIVDAFCPCQIRKIA